MRLNKSFSLRIAIRKTTVFFTLFVVLGLYMGTASAEVTLLQRWDGTIAGDGTGYFVGKLSDHGGNPANPRKDGITDIVISKTCELPFNNTCPSGSGAVLVYSGSDRSLIFQIDGTAWSYTNDVGDLNGDGVPDLFVGQYGLGTAQVYSGLDGMPIPQLNFIADNDTATDPYFSNFYDGFGICVSASGDITLTKLF